MTMDLNSGVTNNNTPSESMQKLPELESGCESTIHVYKRRIWMLFLFCSLSLLSGMLFPQYAVMADVTSCYYGVNQDEVNWTCLMVMVVYIVLVFPVSWLMDNVGIRNTILLGSLTNTISCALQFAHLTPDSFTYVWISQFFASLSNVFVLSIPPCVAAIWFPSKELSRACAFGVFGNQLGVALGFVFPPLMISSDCKRKDLIEEGKRNVAIVLTSINVVILLLIILTFQEEPNHPPSIAQAERKNKEPESYIQSAKTMLKNVQFILIFAMYGLVVGTYFTIATLLNYIILPYFPGQDVAIGWMGLIVIVTGLVGSIIAGAILDYTHKFKQTTTAICILSLISCVNFGCFLYVNKIWVQFITIGILGFFLTSFLPVGFEYAIEVTYPESEITSAGLLNAATMIFGIIMTEITSHVLEKEGAISANAVLCVCLLAGSVISGFITKDYKRSKKNAEKGEESNENKKKNSMDGDEIPSIVHTSSSVL